MTKKAKPATEVIDWFYLFDFLAVADANATFNEEQIDIYFGEDNMHHIEVSYHPHKRHWIPEDFKFQLDWFVSNLLDSSPDLSVLSIKLICWLKDKKYIKDGPPKTYTTKTYVLCKD